MRLQRFEAAHVLKPSGHLSRKAWATYENKIRKNVKRKNGRPVFSETFGLSQKAVPDVFAEERAGAGAGDFVPRARNVG